MMANSFALGELVFRYELAQKDDVWTATLIKLMGDGSSSVEQELKEHGTTPEQAEKRLKDRIIRTVSFSGEPINPWQAAILAFKWIYAGTGTAVRIARAMVVLLVVILIAPFVFDFFSGTSPISKNLKGAVELLRPSGIKPRGYINEEFFAQALQNAHKRFYASGVSFRNLVAGNRNHLIDTLDRGAEFKLVLLDPDSPLASDTYIPKFSRTARKEDINNTLNAFLNPNSGILVEHGNRNRNQLWVSDYAPIVPIVVVDDTVYVSFLIHVDRQRKQNMYDSPYLVFDADSDVGRDLLRHFDNMLDGSGARRLFPQ
jgi:hypothetical protein